MSLVRSRRKKTEGPGEGGESAGMMLTSLMDIFIVLVLYLLVNQSDSINIEPPDRVILPDSGVDTMPRRSIMIALSEKDVKIQGESVVSMAEVKNSTQPEIEAIRQAILRIKAEAEKKKDQSGVDTEVTILADRSIPFKVLKKIMLSSSNAGYGKISFAVNQK